MSTTINPMQDAIMLTNPTLVAINATKAPLFPITSRYYAVATTMLETADGKSIAYLCRRFVPPPERFQVIEEHVVTEGERLDQIAARYLGDPEQFWRICDANAAMRPDDLTATLGRALRITLPEGIMRAAP